jgi:hypothetical protein
MCACVRARRRLRLCDTLRSRTLRVMLTGRPGVRLTSASRTETTTGHDTAVHPILPSIDRVAWTTHRGDQRHEQRTNVGENLDSCRYSFEPAAAMVFLSWISRTSLA